MERFTGALPLAEIVEEDTEYILVEPISIKIPIAGGRTSTLNFHEGDKIHVVEGDSTRGYLIGIFGRATSDRVVVSPKDIAKMKVVSE